MSESNSDGDGDRNREYQVPSFVDVSTNRDGIGLVVTIDEEEFRAAVRREIHVYLQEQLRNPRQSQVLDLIGKFVESWLSRRQRRRNGN